MPRRGQRSGAPRTRSANNSEPLGGPRPMVVPNVTLRRPNPQPLAPAAQPVPVPQQTPPPLSAYSDAELLADFRRRGLVPGLPEGCTQTVPTVPTPVLVTHPSTIGLAPMLASTSSQQIGELCNTTAPSYVPENISVPNQSSLSHLGAKFSKPVHLA